MMKIASDPVDVQELQFKLQCRLKIFDKTEGNPLDTATNLISAASRFGLVFIGCNSAKLKVLRFASIEDYSSADSVSNYLRREVVLPSVPQHVSVNCDHTKLAVIVEKDNCPVVLFYDVQSFFKKTIIIINEVRLSATPSLKILEANWHPTIATIFTECKADGTLGVYELKGKSVDINRLPAESNASCFCWSPKGKQIAVGSKDGKLTHYKPDLKAVKIINSPPFEKSHCIISLQWISNYQFIGVFKPSDASEDQCNVVLIDAPKTGNPSFTNFYDVCYSNGSFRAPQFYMIFEQHWNILIVASANSMEVGVMASTGESWNQWSLPDSARAELPLDENREETYPVGIAIDTSSVRPVPWGESHLQPAPSLLLLSHQGTLCCFKIINLKENASNINSPPENIPDLSGLSAFTAGSASPIKPIGEIVNVTPQVTRQDVVQQQFSSQQPQVEKEVKHSQNTFSVTSITQPDKKINPPTTQFIPQPKQITMQHIQKAPPSAISQPLTNITSATALFGGQVTLTPTCNKGPIANSATSLMGSMLLSNMDAGRSALSVISSSDTKPTQHFSTIGQSLIIPKPITTQPKTAVPLTITQAPAKLQIQATGTTLTSTLSKEPKVELENNEEIEKLLAQMIQMELCALEKELKITLFQGKQLKVNLDHKDMDTIVHQTKGLDNFINDVIETSESQSSEVHILKQNTIQSWAWLEEAKSRYQETRNQELSTLLKSKPLDSVSEKHLHTLKQMEYYLDSQLSQAHRALDEQWDKFQEYCRKSNRVQLPTMEAIFQTMVKQNAILQKHDYILKDIISQIKGKKKDVGGVPLFNRLNKNKSLEDSFQRLKLEPEDIYRIYYQKVLNRVKSMSVTKSKQLKNILRDRDVPHVMVKLQKIDSVLGTTPERKNKSILVHMTPTTKPSATARTLNFYQSTPLSIKSEYPLSTQIPSSSLSAFAPTNSGLASGKSQPESQKFSNFGVEMQKEGIPVSSASVQNFNIADIVAPPKSSNSFIAKTPETRVTASSANFLLGSEVKAPLLITALHEEQHKPAFEKKTLVPHATSSFGSSIHSSAANFQVATPKLTGTTTNVSTSSSVFQITTTCSILPSAFSKPVFSAAAPSTVPSLNTNTISGSRVIFGENPSSGIQFGGNAAEKLIDLTAKSVGTTNSASPIFAQTTVTCTSAVISSAFGVSSSAASLSISAVPTKSTFFTPITSTQLSCPVNTSQHSADVAASSDNTSAFLQVTTQSPISTPKLTVSSVTSSTLTSDSPLIFGKSSSLSTDNTPTTNSVSSSKISSPTVITTRSSLAESVFHSSTNTSTKPPLFVTKTIVTSAPQPGSVFGSMPSSGSSTGFSFLAGTSSLSGQSTIFGSASTAFSPVAGGTQATSKWPTTTQSSSASSTSNNMTAGIFNVTSTSVSNTLSPSVTTPTSASNIFSVVSVSSNTSNSGDGISTSMANIFGATAASSTTSSSSKGGIDAISSAVSSPFSGFNPTATSASVFGNSASASSIGTSGSLFGNTPLTTTKSIFAAPVTSSQDVFGTVTSASLFAAPSKFEANPTTTSGTSIFASGSSFGSGIGTPAFGSVSSASSAFGVATTSSTPVFGSAGIFGVPATSASPFTGSPFGAPATASSPFGSVATPATSPFGVTTTSSTPPFAAINSTSPFGATPTSSTSPFGATITSATSPFGKPSVFGQASSFGIGFGATQPTSATSAPIFGQAASGPSQIFGASTTTNVFGGTTSTSSFGATASPFGTSTAGNTSAFGQTAASGGLFGSTQGVFGASSNENVVSSFGFGSLNVGASTQSPFTKTTEAKSPFGGSTFSNTSSGSLFGSPSFGSAGGGNVFGQSTFGTGTNFSVTQPQPGPFSGSSGSVAQAGFGAAPAFQKPSGFGAQPTFGGSPAFGAAPTFGGGPSFGSTSPFGSPNKVFGSSSQPGMFGSNNQQSSGFGNLANQNTIGFGNLAQQSTNNNSGQSAPFSGNSSFSSWR